MRIACNTGSGLGGSQKAAWLYACGLAKLGHQVRILTTPGPMGQNFDNSCLEVVEMTSEQEWEEFYTSGWPEVVHNHAPGYANTSLFYDILEKMPKRPFRVVETNVFGWLSDPRSQRHVDFRAFISMASGAQAFRRAGIRTIQPYLANHTVLYYPVPEAPVIPSEMRKRIRKELGIREDEILAVRFGRPDGRKWGDWECRAFRMAKTSVPKLRFLMIEPPDRIKQRVDSGEFGPDILYRDMITSQEEIAKINQAADIGLHASRFGESFGYTIAEAMAAGLPVISRTTPWGDNAQVELIQHGVSGHICDSVEGIADALVKIANSSSLRSEMGCHARKRILSLASPVQEAAILSDICLGNTGPGTLVYKRNLEFAEFCSLFPELERRCDAPDRGNTSLKTQAKTSCEKAWFMTKSKIRVFRAALRTRLGLPAYR